MENPDTHSLESFFPGVPAERFKGILIFTFLCISIATVGFAVCTTYLLLTDTAKLWSVRVFLTSLVVAWYCFSASDNLRTFVKLIVPVSFVCIWPMFTVYLDSVALFFISIAVFGYWILRTARNQGESTQELFGPFRSVIFPLYSLWLVFTSLLSIGSYFQLKFIVNALNISQVHQLLDIRYALTAVVALLTIISAVLAALREPPPNITPLAMVQLPLRGQSSQGIALVVSRALLTIVNALLVLLHRIADILWRFVAFIVTYLFRAASHISKQIFEILRSTAFWKYTLKISATILIIFASAYLIAFVAPKLQYYLSNVVPLFPLNSPGLVALTSIFGAFLSVLVLQVLAARLWCDLDPSLIRATLAGAMLIISTWFSANFLYLLRYLRLFEIQGFQSYGLFSASLLVILVTFLFYQIVKLGIVNLKSQQRA